MSMTDEKRNIESLNVYRREQSKSPTKTKIRLSQIVLK